MRAYQLVEFGKPFEMRELPDPTPTGAQVLIKVLKAGVCHSDLHIAEGYFDYGDGQKFKMSDRGMQLPMTLGHEIYGEVISAGPDAGAVEIGAKVLVHPWIGCGTCRACREERENDCAAMKPLGILQDGGYATHVLTPDASHLINADGLDPASAVSFTCAGITVFAALKKLLPLHDEEWLAVIGAGGLGLNGITIAKALGVKNLLAVDVDDAKLEAAMEMGADAALNVRAHEDPDAALREITGGIFMAALDTVGAESTIGLATRTLHKTGRYVIVGLFGGSFKLSLPLLPQRELTLRGSYVGSRRDLRELVELAKTGALKPIPVSERPLSAANETMEDLAAGKIVGRVVLTTAE
ncbi:MAG: alcohol dehydrogenase [Neomegalonema sp.]|nr:alcohol dehydrogenase [Neomegalonema sp.]